MRPVFQPKQFMRVVPIVVETSAEMLLRWQQIAEHGESLDLLREMRMLTRAMILRILFGNVVPAARARAVGEALDFALEHEDCRLWSPLGWLDLPTPRHQRFPQALRVVDDFVAGMIGRARREGASPGTLLCMLMEARDAESGEPMPDADLREEVKALLVAGHATTASALSRTWYVLHEFPQARHPLQEELRARLHGRAPNAVDLSSLDYTRMLLDEVLALSADVGYGADAHRR